MSMIRPTFQENVYQTLFQLEPDRPFYYQYVFRLGRSLFISTGQQDLVEQLDMMISEIIEKPLNAPLIAVIQAFYNPRFMMSKNAFTKIGDSINQKVVTRWEIQVRLEHIKDWVYNEATKISPMIRFTRGNQMLT